VRRGASCSSATGWAAGRSAPTSWARPSATASTRDTRPSCRRRTGDAIRVINLDPSHFVHQFLDPARFALEFADRIYHVHVKDARRRLDGRRSILGSHLNFGEEARGWDFVSPGHGDVDFPEFIVDVAFDAPMQRS